MAISRISLIIAAAFALSGAIIANSQSPQSRKPRPPINKPPVTEEQTVTSNRPRVRFQCQQNSSAAALVIDVRNDGPDSLTQGTTVFYFYRTPESDMSITGSHQLASRLDKGGIFSVRLADNAQTHITECGCGLKRFIPTARTTTQKAK